MGEAGRPTKLSPEIADRIVQIVEAGNYREVAANLAGISPTTFRAWMRKGKEEADSDFGDFRRRVLKAEATAETNMVLAIAAKAGEDPKHAQWWLERKFPDRWGKKEQVRHADADGEPIGFVFNIGGKK